MVKSSAKLEALSMFYLNYVECKLANVDIGVGGV